MVAVGHEIALCIHADVSRAETVIKVKVEVLVVTLSRLRLMPPSACLVERLGHHSHLFALLYRLLLVLLHCG